ARRSSTLRRTSPTRDASATGTSTTRSSATDASTSTTSCSARRSPAAGTEERPGGVADERDRDDGGICARRPPTVGGGPRAGRRHPHGDDARHPGPACPFRNRTEAGRWYDSCP